MLLKDEENLNFKLKLLLNLKKIYLLYKELFLLTSRNFVQITTSLCKCLKIDTGKMEYNFFSLDTLLFLNLN